MRAEIAYYRAHLHEGRDAAGLADLRRRCAEAMRADAARPSGARLGALTDALLAALRFRAVPGRGAGAAASCGRPACGSWSSRTGTSRCTSGCERDRAGAAARRRARLGRGRRAPSRTAAIFARALELAGARPRTRWHVGDTLEADVEGALAAGLRPVLIDARRAVAPPPGVPVIASLAELPALCA